ncbi:MAG: nucleotide exchange factor GrpE [Candidatus Bathyarchaeia archaeon]|jgi:molecular chaperone GrpE
MKDSAKNQELTETIKKLEEQLSAEQEKNKDYLNRLRYLQADFENYRKRVEKEVQDTIQKSNAQLVACLVDVLDTLETAICAGETTENKAALLEGIKMVHKNLDNLLAKEGLERLQCVGQAFDPNLHEILAQVPTNEHECGTVLEEARKGFMFRGKVLRPSVVKIACETPEGNEQ